MNIHFLTASMTDFVGKYFRYFKKKHNHPIHWLYHHNVTPTAGLQSKQVFKQFFKKTTNYSLDRIVSLSESLVSIMWVQVLSAVEIQATQTIDQPMELFHHFLQPMSKPSVKNSALKLHLYF